MEPVQERGPVPGREQEREQEQARGLVQVQVQVQELGPALEAGPGQELELGPGPQVQPEGCRRPCLRQPGRQQPARRLPDQQPQSAQLAWPPRVGGPMRQFAPIRGPLWCSAAAPADPPVPSAAPRPQPLLWPGWRWPVPPVPCGIRPSGRRRQRPGWRHRRQTSGTAPQSMPMPLIRKRGSGRRIWLPASRPGARLPHGR